ncbi:MAG TPA: amidohydrolase family protein, partial [Burkholderiales bacterium]|nr:amidohydrolase family protein [Burkholderiales bacterium]
MSGYLIRGAAAIMTGLPGVAARAAGPDIRIADGHVEAIGALEPRPGERVLDASGCAVYPGWVNTHHHLAQCVLKGVPAGINLPLMQWLDAVPYRYRYRFDEDLLRTAAEIGIAELMLSGVTTVADHHYVYWPGIGYDPAAVLFDAAGRLGVRFVLCRGGATVPRDFEARDPRAPKPETLDGIVRDVARLVEAFHDPGPEAMRRVALAPSTPTWSVRPDELNVLARAARELGIRRHSHLSETADYVSYCREVHGMLPVQFVAEHDWLGPDVWFAHMVHLADEEIGLVADSGTGIAHCPASNCRLGSGIARAPELAARGAPVSLGVDGAASNESSDMIAEAHLAWYVHRARGGAGAV